MALRGKGEEQAQLKTGYGFLLALLCDASEFFEFFLMNYV